MKIDITKEQIEDILELIQQHEELCHDINHGTLTYEQIELREFFQDKINNLNDEQTKTNTSRLAKK